MTSSSARSSSSIEILTLVSPFAKSTAIVCDIVVYVMVSVVNFCEFVRARECVCVCVCVCVI